MQLDWGNRCTTYIPPSYLGVPTDWCATKGSHFDPSISALYPSVFLRLLQILLLLHLNGYDQPNSLEATHDRTEHYQALTGVNQHHAIWAISGHAILGQFLPNLNEEQQHGTRRGRREAGGNTRASNYGYPCFTPRVLVLHTWGYSCFACRTR